MHGRGRVSQVYLRRMRRLPPTMSTFLLLVSVAVIGFALRLVTHGWAVGWYLGVACAVVAVQVWLHLRRG